MQFKIIILLILLSSNTFSKDNFSTKEFTIENLKFEFIYSIVSSKGDKILTYTALKLNGKILVNDKKKVPVYPAFPDFQTNLKYYLGSVSVIIGRNNKRLIYIESFCDGMACPIIHRIFNEKGKLLYFYQGSKYETVKLFGDIDKIAKNYGIEV